MHAWEAIQDTLNHIEEHIGEEISIEELAEIAALSLYYYQRLFTRLVKRPVREYIKLRRLARACGALRNKESRILDVALEYGFGSHETFTRAFKDAYGITPAQYRNRPVSLDNFDKPDLLLSYVMVDEGVPLITDGLVLEINRKTLEAPIGFLGLAEYVFFEGGKMLGERPGVSMPNEVWNKFFSAIKNSPYHIVGRTLGVMYKGNAPDKHATYFAGMEAEQTDDPGCFTYWQLPAREYVVCAFEAENFQQSIASAVGKAMKFTRFWLKEHGLIADGFFPEMYYPNSPETAYMELWIPFKKRENNEYGGIKNG